jgi:hypothetical protein
VSRAAVAARDVRTSVFASSSGDTSVSAIFYDSPGVHLSACKFAAKLSRVGSGVHEVQTMEYPRHRFKHAVIVRLLHLSIRQDGRGFRHEYPSQSCRYPTREWLIWSKEGPAALYA